MGWINSLYKSGATPVIVVEICTRHTSSHCLLHTDRENTLQKQNNLTLTLFPYFYSTYFPPNSR